MTLEQLIREDLERAAVDTPGASGAPVGEVMRRARRRTRIKRASVAGLAGLVFVGVLILDPFPGTPLEVAGTDAENVLSTDPLIIRGAPGPEPRFDTSQLGENRDLAPVVDMESYLARVRPSRGFLIDFIEGFTSPPQAKLTRLVTVGYTPEGTAVAIVYTTTWTPTDGTTHWVCLVEDPGGSSCGGDPRNLADADEMVSEVVGGMTVGGPGLLSWGVSPDTSVAMLTVNGERFFQRPVGGAAAFETDLRAGDRLIYTEFDSEGSVIGVRHELAEGDLTDRVQWMEGLCPVTYPDGRFHATEPYPAQPAHVAMVWYGSDELWTALPVDGHGLGLSKTVFWSSAFPGGPQEPEPTLEVTYRRLDIEQPAMSNAGRSTNAHTDEDGWFMIGGINPSDPGCWEVTASYKGTTLSYVYEVREP